VTRIVITSHTSSYNKGNEALLVTTIDMLKDAIPDAEFIVFSYAPELDNRRLRGRTEAAPTFLQWRPASYGRRTKLWFHLPRFARRFSRRPLPAAVRNYQAIRDCDLVIVSGGDVLSGYGYYSLRSHCFYPLVAIALGKPVMVFAHSIDPFATAEELDFARSFLNKAKLITVRENLTERYLKELQIETPVYLTADPAFLLKAASKQEVNDILHREGIDPEDTPLIGMSVSRGIADFSKTNYWYYIKTMAQFADYLIDQYGVCVLFVPHVTIPDDARDDRMAAHHVMGMARRRDALYPIVGDYSCATLKGIIGQCKLFIGARTHSTISSASQGIPTIAIAYSVKAHGIMGALYPADKSVCDIQTLSLDELVAKADYMLANGPQVSETLLHNTLCQRELSFKNAELARALIAG